MQSVQLGGEVPGRVGGLVTITLRSVQKPDETKPLILHGTSQLIGCVYILVP